MSLDLGDVEAKLKFQIIHPGGVGGGEGHELPQFLYASCFCRSSIK